MKHQKRVDEKVIAFRIEGRYKKRIKRIANSLDRETMSDVVEAIIKAFFKENKPPKDMERARELVIMKRKGEL